ncbi:MAG TPA: insulinase family protein [Desulfobacteraceae bacterium]|nr:insulinase family protein [Desulfobacteraceae bacterium]
MKRMKPEAALFVQSFSLLVVILLLLTGCSHLDRPDVLIADQCMDRGWPHEKSDLRPDPDMVFGSLENGFRYVLKRNSEPADRVGLYLNIRAGSLHETDDQRGYAHFLEHMLFNGTTHYPPGTLVKYFQSIGMSFGADTNAHTSFDETVYRILLPVGDRRHLEEGLLVMADFARGALLLEEEVERERGIILAEKRTRDTAGYRLYEQRMRFSFAGARVAERLPIGTDEALVRADASMLRAFYDTWYRPENMVLVVVGDMDIDLTRELIGEQFGPMKAPPGVDPECFEYGKFDEQGTEALYVYEPEVGSTEVSISSRWNTVPRVDSFAWQAEQIKNYVATSLINNRLKRVTGEPGSPLTRARSHSGVFLERFGYVTVTATIEGQKWQQSLELLNRTLRQALEYGFTDRELARVKKEIRAELEKQVQTADSKDSRKLADDIIRKINSNEVFLSPRQELELYGPVVDDLSLDEANKVFRSLWAHKNRQLFIAGTVEIEDGQASPEEVVLAVFDRSEKQELPAWDNGGEISFPYLPEPKEPAAVAGRKRFEDIDMERVVFANGTVVNVKRTVYQPNEVLVAIHFGHGRLEEPLPGLGMLAEAVVRESGVGRLNRSELEEALAGHSVEVTFQVGQESFVLNGKGLAGELELLLQVAATRLLDPAFREEAYQLSMERFTQMYDQMASSVEGMLQLEGERFLAGGNPRYGLAPRDRFMQLRLDQVRDWLAPVLATAQLEVTVVGDVDPGEAVDLIGRYFGTLERESSTGKLTDVLRFPGGDVLKMEAATGIDKAMVVVAWPTDDFWDIERTRRLNILAAILDDRLRLEIREKLGAVYSPAVYSMPSKVAPGYGVIRAMMTGDPAQAEFLAARVKEVAADIAERGVEEEELRRALEPSLTSIKDMLQTNRYWLESVMSLSSRHPEQLEWPLSIRSGFAAITAAEVSAMASMYLRPEQAAVIILEPEGR